ncbi:hypothetical protein T439DRAFT_379963 [Meredithblackwellia eburnea MCA 4105]
MAAAPVAAALGVKEIISLAGTVVTGLGIIQKGRQVVDDHVAPQPTDAGKNYRLNISILNKTQFKISLGDNPTYFDHGRYSKNPHDIAPWSTLDYEVVNADNEAAGVSGGNSFIIWFDGKTSYEFAIGWTCPLIGSYKASIHHGTDPKKDGYDLATSGGNGFTSEIVWSGPDEKDPSKTNYFKLRFDCSAGSHPQYSVSQLLYVDGQFKSASAPMASSRVKSQEQDKENVSNFLQEIFSSLVNLLYLKGLIDDTSEKSDVIIVEGIDNDLNEGLQAFVTIYLRGHFRKTHPVVTVEKKFFIQPKEGKRISLKKKNPPSHGASYKFQYIPNSEGGPKGHNITIRPNFVDTKCGNFDQQYLPAKIVINVLEDKLQYNREPAWNDRDFLDVHQTMVKSFHLSLFGMEFGRGAVFTVLPTKHDFKLEAKEQKEPRLSIGFVVPTGFVSDPYLVPGDEAFLSSIILPKRQSKFYSQFVSGAKVVEVVPDNCTSAHLFLKPLDKPPEILAGHEPGSSYEASASVSTVMGKVLECLDPYIERIDFYRCPLAVFFKSKDFSDICDKVLRQGSGINERKAVQEHIAIEAISKQFDSNIKFTQWIITVPVQGFNNSTRGLVSTKKFEEGCVTLKQGGSKANEWILDFNKSSSQWNSFKKFYSVLKPSNAFIIHSPPEFSIIFEEFDPVKVESEALAKLQLNENFEHPVLDIPEQPVYAEAGNYNFKYAEVPEHSKKIRAAIATAKFFRGSRHKPEVGGNGEPPNPSTSISQQPPTPAFHAQIGGPGYGPPGSLHLGSAYTPPQPMYAQGDPSYAHQQTQGGGYPPQPMYAQGDPSYAHQQTQSGGYPPQVTYYNSPVPPNQGGAYPPQPHQGPPLTPYLTTPLQQPSSQNYQHNPPPSPSPSQSHLPGQPYPQLHPQQGPGNYYNNAPPPPNQDPNHSQGHWGYQGPGSPPSHFNLHIGKSRAPRVLRAGADLSHYFDDSLAAKDDGERMLRRATRRERF